MSKDYVLQLEATIQNLRRDNSILKEENAKYKDLEEETRLSVKEMTMILRDIKYIFNAKLYPNRLRIKDMPMTNWDLILTQPKFHCNNLASERVNYKPITIDCAISETDYEIYSKWLKKDKSEYEEDE